MRGRYRQRFGEEAPRIYDLLGDTVTLVGDARPPSASEGLLRLPAAIDENIRPCDETLFAHFVLSKDRIQEG